jgi:hypothetical protein
VSYDGTAASLFASFDASASSSTASTTLTFQWSVVSSPTNPFPAYVPNATITNPTAAITNVGFTYGGNYIVRVLVSQGCGQVVPVDQAMLVQCNAQITPSFTSTPTGPVVSWDDTVNRFPTLNLADTSTFTFTTNPPAPGQRLITWHYPASGVPDGIGAATTFTPPNNTETTYAVNMLASDGCTYAMSTQTFSFRCLALTATITGAPSTTPTGSTVVLTAGAGAPRAGIPVVATWSFVQAPTLSTATITPTSANTASTTLFAGGTYTIQVSVTDGCTTANTTVTVTVTCNQMLVATASASTTSLTWSNNAFGRVDLNGNSSNTGGRVIGDPSIAVRWLISGPMYSAYYSPTGLITSVQNLPSNTTSTQVIGNYTYITLNLTASTTTTTSNYLITLPLAINEPLLNFPSCFYPDVPGSYSLTLELTDRCQQSTAPISVNTVCSDAPTINITARERDGWNATAVPYIKAGSNTQDNYTWTVTLSRAGLRRVHFDASGTIGAAPGRLSYYWSWRSPDPKANSTAAQANIDLPYGPQAEIVFPSVGTYYLSLSVHDGCAFTQANVTIIAVCDTKSSDVNFNNGSSTARDGSMTSVVQLQNTHLNDGVDPLACSSASWVFYNFTEFSPTGPVTGAGSRVVISFIPFALLLSLLSLFFS